MVSSLRQGTRAPSAPRDTIESAIESEIGPIKQAQDLDAEQDAALGSRRGDELPDELKRREQRLAKIREAKARLEAEAQARAEAEQLRRDEEQAKREAEGRQRRGKEPAPVDPNPEDKAQTNFTDPEAKIMKQSNKRFDYSYNAQAVVDGAEQIIVAAVVTSAANDKQQAVPMAQAELENLNAACIQGPGGDSGGRGRGRGRKAKALRKPRANAGTYANSQTSS